MTTNGFHKNTNNGVRKYLHVMTTNGLRKNTNDGVGLGKIVRNLGFYHMPLGYKRPNTA